jgi:hypothetical protein
MAYSLHNCWLVNCDPSLLFVASRNCTCTSPLIECANFTPYHFGINNYCLWGFSFPTQMICRFFALLWIPMPCYYHLPLLSYEGIDLQHFHSLSRLTVLKFELQLATVVFWTPKNILGTLFFLVAPILEGTSEYDSPIFLLHNHPLTNSCKEIFIKQEQALIPT